MCSTSELYASIYLQNNLPLPTEVQVNIFTCSIRYQTFLHITQNQ